MKYAVVIVTYNRLNLLKECIDCVLRQTITVDKIIIMNNASTDGTQEFLGQYQNQKKFCVVNEKDNYGGAYGFSRGIQIASQYFWDWVIIIDDDAMLEDGYIEKIENEMSKNEECLAYSGSVYCNGIISQEHRSRNRFKRLFKPIPVSVDEYKKRYFEYDLASFCGLMINRKLIEEIGFPEKDFFIRNDDYEYSLRIRKKSVILNINEARINHKTSIVAQQKDLSWKLFYNIRNAIYISGKYYGKSSIVEICIRYILGMFLNIVRYGRRDMKKVRWIFWIYLDAIVAGIKGEIGINEKYVAGVSYEKR